MTSRLATLLAASLLLNVFAAGAIGGGLLMLSRQGGLRPHAAAPRRPVDAAGVGLPQPDRRRFSHAMRAAMQDGGDLVRGARESREAAAGLFVEPRFDTVAVAAALDRAREADFELRRRLEAAAVGFAATLPADERAILAAGLEHGGPLRRPPRAAAPPAANP